MTNCALLADSPCLTLAIVALHLFFISLLMDLHHAVTKCDLALGQLLARPYSVSAIAFLSLHPAQSASARSRDRGSLTHSARYLP